VACSPNDERTCAVPTPWYLDADADGHGGRDGVLFACERPDGHSFDSDDCDDSTAQRAPGLVESCDGIDNDCNGTVDDLSGGGTWYVDQDQDGYGDPAAATTGCNFGGERVVDSTDCDDHNDNIWPGAEETCDDIDQDCDGVVDDSDAIDTIALYVDGDNDSYGGGASVGQGCAPLAGQVTTHGDCDDGDASVYPGATEWCNGIDDDCDRVVDPDSSVDAVTWYQDDDADGYGTGGGITCSPPEDSVSIDGDCDDAQAWVNPSAIEVCNYVDDDCDGVIDSDAAEADTLYRDGDEDTFGDASRAIRSCFGTPGFIRDDSDCDDSDDSVSPDGEERCANGLDDDCDGVTDVAPCVWAIDSFGARIAGSNPSDELGGALAWGGDSDGDGVNEVLVGAEGYTRAADDAGAAFLLRGPHTATALPADADAVLVGAVAHGEAGYAVAFAGDTNLDGFDDLLVGAPSAAAVSHGSEGAAYLFLGPRSGTWTAADADASIIGATNDDTVGWSVAGVGDVDGDGWPDVAVGAPGADAAPTGREGVALLLHGPVTGSFDLYTDTWLQIFGDTEYGSAGTVVAGGTDHDGDGIDDIVVSAYRASLAPKRQDGAVYVLSGLEGGIVSTADATAVLRGDSTSDYLGYGLSSPGDLDGDGLDDLLIGTPYASPDATSNGAIYLVRGPITASATISTVAAATLLGASSSGLFGSAMDSAGDIDGDGNTDLVLGTPYRYNGTNRYAGAAIVVYGPFSGSSVAEDVGVVMTGLDADQDLGTAVAGLGDVDGDGVPDLLIGAPGDSTGGSYAGALWFVSGAGL
jgi:Putative metal-binding motif/FG-GAP repeat